MAPSTLRGRADSTRSRQARPAGLAAAERAAAKRAARKPGVGQADGTSDTAGTTGVVDAPATTESTATGLDSEAAGAAATAEAPSGDGARSRPRLLPLGLGAGLSAALVTAVLFGLQYRAAERTDQARGAAVAAARTAAPVIFSYDYRHLDADFATASGYLTGAFRSQYARTTSTVVKPTAAQYHGVVKATVAAPPNGGDPAAAVVSASPDQVVVLLFVNQTTTSTQITGTHLDQNRVRMTMVRTAQGWKVDAVDAL